MRPLIALNWVGGTLLIGAAVVYPLIAKTVNQASDAVVADTVRKIADAQNGSYRSFQQYILFSGEPSETTRAFNRLGVTSSVGDDYLYESFIDEEGALVIRARVNPRRVVKDGVTPKVYIYRSRGENQVLENGWKQLSKNSGNPGFF